MPGTKQIDPSTVKGIDSASDVFQNTDSPINKNITPTIDKNADKTMVRFGRDGLCKGGGGLGSNLGVLLILQKTPTY